MHVLLGGEQPIEPTWLTAELRHLGHKVCSLETPEKFLEWIRDNPRPDVAVLSKPSEAWLNVLRSFPEHVYVIGLLPRLTAKRVREAWDLGVDDMTTPSASRDELCGRIAALDRIRRWVSSLGDDFMCAEFDLRQLASYQKLDALLCENLGGMLSVSMQAEELDELPEIDVSAELSLLLPETSSELRLGVGIESEHVPAFMEGLFGSPDDTLLLDGLCELANLSGGALKRSALEEGRTFSIGIPERHEPPSEPLRALRVRCDRFSLLCWVYTRTHRPRQLGIASLKEGMVVGQPIHNGHGMLLLPRGAVLTERTIERLGRWLGENALVEVIQAA